MDNSIYPETEKLEKISSSVPAISSCLRDYLRRHLNGIELTPDERTAVGYICDAYNIDSRQLQREMLKQWSNGRETTLQSKVVRFGSYRKAIPSSFDVFNLPNPEDLAEISEYLLVGWTMQVDSYRCWVLTALQEEWDFGMQPKNATPEIAKICEEWMDDAADYLPSWFMYLWAHAEELQREVELTTVDFSVMIRGITADNRYPQLDYLSKLNTNLDTVLSAINRDCHRHNNKLNRQAKSNDTK